MKSSGSRAPSPLSAHTKLPVRLELVVIVATLVAVAVLISVAAMASMSDARAGDPRLAAALALDVAVCAALGWFAVRRFVLAPLARLATAADALAAGDGVGTTSRELPAEFARVSHGIERAATRLATERADRARAEQLARLGRLSTGIAHEIGNPLGAINGYAYILAQRLDPDSPLHDAVDGIERESVRINRIVRGLLDYGRPKVPTPAVFDVNDATRSAVAILHVQGVLRGASVREELDATAPRLAGDRHQFEQVLVNLLLNARDAIPSGASVGEVVVRTQRISRASLEERAVRRADDPPFAMHPRAAAPLVQRWLERVHPPAEVLTIVVADNGPGVPAAERERIFEPFVTSKHPGQGTGLGLAIVASAVETLGGTVWVERSREGGAAFHLLFPIAVGLGAPLRRDRTPAHIVAVHE